MLNHVGADLFERRGGGVLGRDHHGVNADGLAVFVVFDSDLCLSVGLEIGNRAVLSDLSEFLCHFMREGDRQGHQLLRLVAGKAEHHALIARADHIDFAVAETVLHLVGAVDAHGDVGRLFVDGGDDRAGIAIEARLVAVVTDADDHIAGNFGNIHIAVRRQLAHH